MSYNYKRFKASHILDALGSFDETVPARLSLRDFFAVGEYEAPTPLWQEGVTVIEMGALTCPLYASNIAPMRELMQAHPKVTFKVLAVREAHPGERLGTPISHGLKYVRRHLIQLAFKESREILTEDLNGTLHKMLGSMPNSVFIVDSQGRIAYASPFNNPEMTERALELVLQGEPVGVKPVTRPESPFTRIGVKALLLGGVLALWDMVLAMPALVRG